MFTLKFSLILILGFVSVECITRHEVIQRASTWVSQHVPYSMEAQHAGPNGKKYRTDCSGFVSMAWKLPSSLTTGTLHTVAHQITKEQLATGDIMLMPPQGKFGHTFIFEKWSNKEHTHYWAYEQHGPHGTPTVHREIPYPYFHNDHRYHPWRYNHIE